MNDDGVNAWRSQVNKLYSEGHVAGALDALWAYTREHPDDPQVAYWALYWLSNKAIFDAAALSLVDCAEEEYSQNPDYLFLAAQALIMAPDRTPESYARALSFIKESVRLNPDDNFAHLTMCRIHLLQNDYMGAYLSGCASAYLGHDPGSLFELSKLLIKGVEVVSIPYAGDEYSFKLSTRTPACVHTSGLFLTHNLTEAEELEYTRDVIGPVNSVIEIGTLMGTHTAFYLKNLKPKTMVCVEAIPELAQVTLSTAEMNQDENNPCDVRIVNAWAGNETTGSVEIDGRSVQKLSIDSMVSGQCDFIKIDVDGAELSVLQGAERLLRGGKPKLMVEIAKLNETEVLGWLAALGYEPVHIVRRTNDSNFFLERNGTIS